MAGTEVAVQSNGSLPLTPKIDISAAHTADEEKVGHSNSKRGTSSKEGRHRKSDASRKRKKRTPAGRTRSAADEAPEAAGHRSRDRTISVEAPTRRPSSAREASTSGGGGGGGGICADNSSDGSSDGDDGVGDGGGGGGRSRGSTGGTSSTSSRGALGFLSLIPTEYHAPPPSQKLRHTTALSAVMLESDTISHDSDLSSVSESDAPLSPSREPEPQPDLSQGLTFGFMSAEGGKQNTADDSDCLQPESGEFDPQMAGEGWLKRRVKAGKWKDVWCSLNFNGILKEHKDDDSDEATKTIKVSLCSISKDALTRHAFRLKIKSKTTIYQAPDSEAFAMWLPSLAQYTHEMFTTLEIGSLSFPTIVCNQRCIIVRANREAERLLGYQMKEMVGRHLSSLVAAHREDDSNAALLRCISKGARELKGTPVVRLTHLSGEPLALTMDLGRYSEPKHGDKYIIAFKLVSNKKRLDLDAVRGVKIKWLTADEEVTNEDEFMKSQAKLHKFFGD